MCSAQVYLTECHSGKLLDWSHKQSPNRRLTKTSSMKIPIVRMKKIKTMLTRTMIPLRTAVHLEQGQHFLVAESCLTKLLEKCGVCGSPYPSSLNLTRGTMVAARSQCTFDHVCEWESQQCLNGIPCSNIFFFFLLMPLCSVGQLPQSVIDCSST